MSEKASNFSNPNYQPHNYGDVGDSDSLIASRRRGDTGIPSIDASAKLHESIERIRGERDKAVRSSFEDSLTGCYNRKFLDHLLLERKLIYDDKTCVVFFDVNNLKVVNDEKGHQAGDELIVNTAKFLKDNFREKDMVFRYGGDEFFVIYFADANDDNYKDNLDHKLKPFESELNSMNVPISLACGHAFYDSSEDTGFMDTIARADLNMLDNKLKMKNIESTLNI